MSMERTVFIVKPEAVVAADNIHRMIEAANLVISRPVRFLFPGWGIETLYPDLSDGLLVATRQHLVGRECEVGLVFGEQAISTLIQICGESTDSEKCSSSTIRFRFSCPARQVGGRWYYPNAIHRSRNLAEARRDAGFYRRVVEGALVPVG